MSQGYRCDDCSKFVGDKKDMFNWIKVVEKLDWDNEVPQNVKHFCSLKCVMNYLGKGR